MKNLLNPNSEFYYSGLLYEVQEFAQSLRGSFEYLSLTAQADYTVTAYSGLTCDVEDPNSETGYSPSVAVVTCERTPDRIVDCRLSMSRDGVPTLHTTRGADGLWGRRPGDSDEDLDDDGSTIAMLSTSMGRLATPEARAAASAYLDRAHETPNLVGFLDDIVAPESTSRMRQQTYSAACTRLHPTEGYFEDFTVDFVGIEKETPRDPKSTTYRLSVTRPVVRDGNVVSEVMQLQYLAMESGWQSQATDVYYLDGDEVIGRDVIQDPEEFLDYMKVGLEYLLDTKNPMPSLG